MWNRVKKYIKIILIKINLIRQLKLKSKVEVEKQKKLFLFPVIEFSHYQIFQMLILAKALSLRGYNILILMCDGYLDACEIKSVKNENNKNPCFNCKNNIKQILPLFNFEVIKFSDFFCKEDKDILKQKLKSEYKKSKTFFYEGTDYSKIVEDSTIRYFYGKPGGLNIDEIRLNNFLTAVLSDKIFKIILDKYKFDEVINNMSSYSVFEPYYNNCKRLGIPYHLITLTQFNLNAVLYNWPEYYENLNRFNKWKKSRNKKELNKKENEELDKFLKSRFKGNVEIFKNLNYFDDSNFNFQKLKINPNKKNYFLFSNIYWDVGMSDLNICFNSILDWVYETVKILQNHDEIHLYIKPHPGEYFDTAKSLFGVEQYIKSKFENLPTNVTFIRPELKINTYSLIPFVDLAIVYNGTIGLEMLNKNKNVVVCAKAPYRGLSGTFNPENFIQYSKILVDFNNQKPIDIDQIRLFSYFYFIKSNIIFNLTEKVYGDNFMSYKFSSLDDLLEYKNPNLDHLLSCILNNQKIPENW